MLALTLALTVTLGISQTLLGPGPLPDSPMIVLDDHRYLSLGETYRYDADLQPLGVAIERGAPGTFDSCGAWLQAVYNDVGLVRGWYHAETECGLEYDYQTHKSAAYVESYDGGLTFVKLGQIITAPPYIPDSRYDDEGDFRVIPVGDYFYLYFLATRTGRIHLARSLISDGGRPGTWLKWYQGGFTEPGLGGESEPIAWQWELLAPWSVTWNSYLQRYIGLARRHEGWALTTSEDGIQWTPTDCVLLPMAGSQWAGRTEAMRPLMSYVQFIGDGPAVDLYFMMVPGDFDHRYLMRRGVILEGEAGGSCVTQEAEWPVYLPEVGN